MPLVLVFATAALTRGGRFSPTSFDVGGGAGVGAGVVPQRIGPGCGLVGRPSIKKWCSRDRQRCQGKAEMAIGGSPLAVPGVSAAPGSVVRRPGELVAVVLGRPQGPRLRDRRDPLVDGTFRRRR